MDEMISLLRFVNALDRLGYMDSHQQFKVILNIRKKIKQVKKEHLSSDERAMNIFKVIY